MDANDSGGSPSPPPPRQRPVPLTREALERLPPEPDGYGSTGVSSSEDNLTWNHLPLPTTDSTPVALSSDRHGRTSDGRIVHKSRSKKPVVDPRLTNKSREPRDRDLELQGHWAPEVAPPLASGSGVSRLPPASSNPPFGPEVLGHYSDPSYYDGYRAPVRHIVRDHRKINLKPVTRHYQGRTVIRRLYVERHQSYSDYLSEGFSLSEKYREPPVIWEATVFNVENDRTPAAIYYDDRPLEFKLKHGKAEHRHSTTSKITDDDHYSPGHLSWNGAVVEISVQAMAHQYTNDGLDSAAVHEYDVVPAQMDSLMFDRVSRRDIRIKSPFLYHKLREIIGYYPSFYGKLAGNLLDTSLRSHSEVDTNFTISEPYAVLMHYFMQIEAVINNIEPEKRMDEDVQDDQSTKHQLSRLGAEHLNHLYDFLKPIYNDRVLPCLEELDNPSPRVTFAMLWWIYKPGTSVYVRTSRVVHTCIIADIKSNLDCDHNDAYSRVQTGNDVKYWVLSLWYLDSDGMRIARSQTSYTITAYMGPKEITSLDVCPVSTWDAFDKGERRNKIMTRSKYLLNALQKGFLLARYDGPCYDGLRYVSMYVPCSCH